MFSAVISLCPLNRYVSNTKQMGLLSYFCITLIQICLGYPKICAKAYKYCEPFEISVITVVRGCSYEHHVLYTTRIDCYVRK